MAPCEILCLPIQEMQETQNFDPGLRKSPWGGNGNLLQDSYVKNPMDRGAWWATVHGVPKKQTQLTTDIATDQQQRQEATELVSDQDVLTLNPINFVHW